MSKRDGRRQVVSWKQPTYLRTVLTVDKTVGCFQILPVDVHHVYTATVPRSGYIATVWLLYTASTVDGPLRPEIKRDIGIYIYI